LDTTTENDAPLTFDFDALDDAARACADATTRAGGGFVDHDYAGIERQLDANLAKVYDASHPLGYGAMPGSNPTNDAEVVVGCVARLAPEADNPIAQEADAQIRLAESASQFKADDDPSVLSWVGWLRQKAEKLKGVQGSDEIQIARALCRDAVPDYPSIVTMPGESTQGNPARRWIDDRARGKSDPPRNISLATFLRGCLQAARDATKPIFGKLQRDISRAPQGWLWPGHIPLREVTLLYGGEGLGKGFILSSVAATVARGGQFPDGSSCAPCAVLWLSGEDSYNTVGKRLAVLGAPDDDSIVVLDGLEEEVEDKKTGEMRGLSIKDDISWLEGFIKDRPRTRLIIIEPLSSFAGRTKLIDESAVRNDIIRPLTKLARRYNVAVVTLAHPNKDSNKNAADRASGSRALTAAPRSVVMVGVNPRDSEQRIFACRKPSLGAPFTSRTYRIDEVPGEEMPKFEWGTESDLTYGELDLYPSRSGGTQRPSRRKDEAREFLHRFLADGPHPEAEVEEAAKKLHLSMSTVRRAAFDAPPIAKTERAKGYQAGCTWSLV
jgi:putative DNA primase/helicase